MAPDGMGADPLAPERGLLATAPIPFAPPVSWSAVFAGALASLAASVLLTSLAAGFGLALSLDGVATRASLAGFDSVTGAWMVGVQALSSALGGYLAGRLRSHWGVHADEAHFRDTAHGFLAWALATVAGLVLAVAVTAPYAEHLAGTASALQAAGASPGPTAAEAARAAGIAGQSAFFIGMGLLLGAFAAAVAGAIGGLRTEEMIARRP